MEKKATKREREANVTSLHIQTTLEKYGMSVEGDGLVSWHAGSQGHPRAWSLGRKIYDTTVIIAVEFVMTLFSMSGASSAMHSQSEFGISQTQAVAAFTTTYLVGQAFGGLFLAPFTETFGRKPAYVSAAFFYSIFCVIIAAPQSLAGVVIGRIGSGVLSAMGTTVAAGSLEDIWDEYSRIWVIWTWVAIAVSALGIGPVIGTYVVTSDLGWRWLYYIAAICLGVLTLFALGMQESRSSRALMQRIKVIGKTHGHCSCFWSHLYCDDGHRTPSARIFITTYLTRPVRLLFTEPVVLIITIMQSLSYASIYILPEAFTVVYQETFGFSERQSSLVELTVSIGSFLSFFTRLLDIRIAKHYQKMQEPLTPEAKLMGLYTGAPSLAAAVWWFSWTIPPAASSVSPFVSMAALILVGYAVTEFDYVLTGYLCDAYPNYAASANAPLGFVRAVCSGCFPLFGRSLFQALGNNIAGTVLAAIATSFVFCAAGFWRYGRRLREASAFASGNKMEVELQQERHINGATLV